jgi:hypothetical protein
VTLLRACERSDPASFILLITNPYQDKGPRHTVLQPFAGQ